MSFHGSCCTWRSNFEIFLDAAHGDATLQEAFPEFQERPLLLLRPEDLPSGIFTRTHLSETHARNHSSFEDFCM